MIPVVCIGGTMKSDSEAALCKMKMDFHIEEA